MEPPPYQSKRTQFQEEFLGDCAKVASQFDALEAFAADLMRAKSATKGDREELTMKIRLLRQEIEANMPFVLTQFNEQMDRTVMEAKGEVEAFVQHRLASAGLQAIQDKTLLSIEDQATATEPRSDQGGDR